jgi:hypothetical protein
MISRRSLLLSLPALLCAPAIVRAESLMKVSAFKLKIPDVWPIDDEIEPVKFAFPPFWGDDAQLRLWP